MAHGNGASECGTENPVPNSSPGASSTAPRRNRHRRWDARKWDVMATTLQRPSQGQGRVIGGVCAAIADRFGISRTPVRAVFVIFGLMGPGVPAYIVLWVLIPPSNE